MPWGATAVNGITDRMLRNQPALSQVLPLFLEFLGDPRTILLAHNAPFDLAFLNHAVAELDLSAPMHRVVDTVPLAQALLPRSESYRLPALAAALGLPIPGHRSLEDALAVMRVFLRLVGQNLSWLDEHTLLKLAGCSRV
jgi:DNA polymerase-3 subunit epsilon